MLLKERKLGSDQKTSKNVHVYKSRNEKKF